MISTPNTELVRVTYEFKLSYECDEHREELMNDLRKAPINEMGGAGMVRGEAKAFSCKRVGKGELK